MNRRSILLGMGTAAAGAGAVFGSGAFTQVQTERELTIGVDEDSAALLELNASGDAASVTNGDNGELVIDTDKLSTETGDSSQGFAVGSTVEIGVIDDSDNVSSGGEAFTLTNNFDDVGDGSADLDVGIDLTNIDLSDVSGLTSLEFYGTPSNSNGTQVTSAGGRNVFDVASGEKIYFAIKFTTASTTGPTGLDDATVAFQAGSDLTSGDFPTPQPVVVRSGDETSFTSIQAAIDDDDTNDDDTLTVAGTSNESVTIDVEGLTLEAAEGANPTVTQNSGSVVDITADGVTVDGLIIRAENDATGVSFGFSAEEDLTLMNNEFDVVGDDGTGIDSESTSSAGTIDISNNKFNADGVNGENGDLYVDDSSSQVLELDTLETGNEFNLDVNQENNRLIPAITVPPNEFEIVDGDALEQEGIITDKTKPNSLKEAFATQFSVNGFETTVNSEIRVDGVMTDPRPVVDGSEAPLVSVIFASTATTADGANLANIGGDNILQAGNGRFNFDLTKIDESFVDFASSPSDLITRDGGMIDAIDELETNNNNPNIDTIGGLSNVRLAFFNSTGDSKFITGLTVDNSDIALTTIN